MPNYKQRRDKLRRLVRETNADAILVTSYDNVTYLTGFTGDSSYLLLTRDGQIILSDKRYTTQLENECPNIDLDIRGPESTMLECVAKLVRKTKLGSLAIEAGNVTLEFFQKLEEKLAKVDLVATGGLVEQLREIKDKDELTEIREAIGIAERAFAVVKAGLRPEQTEKQVCDEIERQVRLFGGACTAFWPIVGVGPNGRPPALPPGRSESRRELYGAGRLGCQGQALHERLDPDHRHGQSSREVGASLQHRPQSSEEGD